MRPLKNLQTLYPHFVVLCHVKCILIPPKAGNEVWDSGPIQLKVPTLFMCCYAIHTLPMCTVITQACTVCVRSKDGVIWPIQADGVLLSLSSASLSLSVSAAVETRAGAKCCHVVCRGFGPQEIKTAVCFYDYVLSNFKPLNKIT